MVNCWKEINFQSAAKPEEIQEGSETISKESTPQGGSAMPLTCNDEGDDIVQQIYYLSHIPTNLSRGTA